MSNCLIFLERVLDSSGAGVMRDAARPWRLFSRPPAGVLRIQEREGPASGGLSRVTPRRHRSGIPGTPYGTGKGGCVVCDSPGGLAKREPGALCGRGGSGRRGVRRIRGHAARRVVGAACDSGADFILVAGDTFGNSGDTIHIYSIPDRSWRQSFLACPESTRRECRRFPRWVMRCGIPGTTTRAIRAMSPAYSSRDAK